ncbi:hypothetical protein EWM64_g1426 [Hericium alpestre]|uniref:Kinetochore protein Nuf2 N-terminal domain-containing protein n=1 Tax=Hericium alpestre TaxID=135208 RepID=A0A4Z0A8D5_9AGAM|nr:hypothetical protein EWM64_g1426 [Hericium alpestre]
MEKKQYWFPSMDPGEIVLSLQAWGLQVNAQQLVKPTSDFVARVYTACVEQVSGINEETLEGPLEAALASLDEPNTDIYAGSLAMNLLIYHITRFANVAKIHDFSAKDIYFPERERTRSILSAFINFIKFTEQCQGFVNGLREKSAARVGEREQVSRELAEVRQRIAMIKAQRAEDEPLCEDLRAENAAITAHLIATKEIQGTLLKDIEALKAEKMAVLQRKARRPLVSLSLYPESDDGNANRKA